MRASALEFSLQGGERSRSTDCDQAGPFNLGDPPGQVGQHSTALIATIELLESTPENRLRDPKFVALVDDRDAAQVVRER
jgi:hypothetical protein